MERYEQESDILKHAAEALHRETGLDLSIEEASGAYDEHPEIDAFIRLNGQLFAAEVKKWAQHSNFGALIHQVKSWRSIPTFLIADYINSKMADRLKDEKVQFIDTAGNAYINSPPLYIFITGNRQPKNYISYPATNRAFEPAGLKIIYALLCDPALVKASYRELAEKADVSVGTVGWVFQGLKGAGYVLDRGKKEQRQLLQQHKLLSRWVEAYATKLQPKLLVGHFQAQESNWWQSIHIQEYGAYWGGEVAAARYTKYLKPAHATIYLPRKSGNRLLADAKLRKAQPTDASAMVTIYRPFWHDAAANRELVHPILVYADLVTSGDSRNLEVAQIIYDEHITGHLKSD